MIVENEMFACPDAHIEAVFGGLSPAQKTSLKRLYKTVLCLCKMYLRM